MGQDAGDGMKEWTPDDCLDANEAATKIVDLAVHEIEKLEKDLKIDLQMRPAVMLRIAALMLVHTLVLFKIQNMAAPIEEILNLMLKEIRQKIVDRAQYVLDEIIDQCEEEKRRGRMKKPLEENGSHPI